MVTGRSPALDAWGCWKSAATTDGARSSGGRVLVDKSDCSALQRSSFWRLFCGLTCLGFIRGSSAATRSGFLAMYTCIQSEPLAPSNPDSRRSFLPLAISRSTKQKRNQSLKQATSFTRGLSPPEMPVAKFLLSDGTLVSEIATTPHSQCTQWHKRPVLNVIADTAVWTTNGARVCRSRRPMPIHSSTALGK